MIDMEMVGITIESILFICAIFGVFPLIAIIWFIVALILFLKTDKTLNEKRRRRKNWLIVSSAVTVAVTAAQFGVWYLFSQAMAHM